MTDNSFITVSDSDTSLGLTKIILVEGSLILVYSYFLEVKAHLFDFHSGENQYKKVFQISLDYLRHKLES